MPQVQHPANVITFVRAVLALTVALVGPTGPGLAIVVVALALDWVDGQVARRTGTASAFGARFDMETDAFLILVLSAYAVPVVGGWVLLLGAARYLLWLAERVLPWLRRPVPPRYWRKVVAAIQGIALAVAVSGVLPVVAVEALLVAALALLAESFGRDVWWLWRTRSAPAPYPRGGGLTLLALGAVWVALTLPERPGDLVRLPVETLLLLAVAVLPWRRARHTAALLLGLALGAVLVLRVFDLGFERILDRSFDPTVDWVYLGPAVGVLGDSIGVTAARATAVAAVLVVVAVLVVLPLATARVSGTLAHHRRGSNTLPCAAPVPYCYPRWVLLMRNPPHRVWLRVASLSHVTPRMTDAAGATPPRRRLLYDVQPADFGDQGFVVWQASVRGGDAHGTAVFDQSGGIVLDPSLVSTACANPDRGHADYRCAGIVALSDEALASYRPGQLAVGFETESDASDVTLTVARPLPARAEPRRSPASRPGTRVSARR